MGINKSVDILLNEMINKLLFVSATEDNFTIFSILSGNLLYIAKNICENDKEVYSFSVFCKKVGVSVKEANKWIKVWREENE